MGRCPSLWVILVMVLSNPTSRTERADLLGVRRFVPKPFDTDDFARKIARFSLERSGALGVSCHWLSRPCYANSSEACSHQRRPITSAGTPGS